MVEANWVKRAARSGQLGLVEEEIVATKDEEAFEGVSSAREGPGHSFKKAESAGASRVVVPKGQGEEHAGTETLSVILIAFFEDIEKFKSGKTSSGEDIDHMV
jgi:hypothetical protein